MASIRFCLFNNGIQWSVFYLKHYGRYFFDWMLKQYFFFKYE